MVGIFCTVSIANEELGYMKGQNKDQSDFLHGLKLSQKVKTVKQTESNDSGRSENILK